MPLVSIILPFYNAEKTIDRCIGSILRQSCRDFELLLLDDGSTDGSGRICDDYVERDSRVRVLHKENTGVSDTRNQGIAMARGEYLQFADGDDWLPSDATGSFVHAAESGCDMVIADFYRVIGERVSQKGDIGEAGLTDRAGYAAAMMRKPADFYYGVLWNKFYRRSIIEEYQLKMDTAISWCEDFMFNLEYVRHVKSVYVLKVPVYYYVKTKGSLVSQGASVKNTIQMKRTVFTCYNNFYKDVFDEADYEKKKAQVYRFLLDAASDGSVLPINISGNYRLGEERVDEAYGVTDEVYTMADRTCAMADGTHAGTDKVCARALQAVPDGSGILFDGYRERKLQDKLFASTAQEYGLSMADVKVLYYFSQPHDRCTYKEIADILSVSKRELSSAIQRLLAKNLLAVPEKIKEKTRDKAKQKGLAGEKQKEERRKANVREYVVAEKAEGILSRLQSGLREAERIQYAGFSQEEMELYERLEKRRKQNLREAF